MTEAETIQPDPQPASIDTAERPQAPAGIALDFDNLDAGDLEDMEDYCGRPVFGLLQEALAQAPEGVNPLAALMMFLPAKVLTALLGVSKRHQDPSFGPERWRSIKLSELAGSEPGPFEEPAEESREQPTPIRGSTVKRGASSARRPSSGSTSKPG